MSEEISVEMSGLLKKARLYENEESRKIPADQKPGYHMTVPVGWLNDPNGLSVYKKEFHMFYQYNPYDTKWGAIHWGHVKSKDLVTWEYLPIAMAPDSEYDSFGVFSGSALEDGDHHVLLYTGCVKEVLPDGSEAAFSYQCVAAGNGLEYRKESRPAITADLLPEGCSREQLRDPKIWKEDGTYYAVLGNQYAGGGQAVLFSAENLSDWKFRTILDQSENKYGRMWECPDFFPLGEKQILMVSPTDMTPEGLEFHDGNGTAFLVGSYQKETMKFQRKSVQAVDYGLNFYAPQTMETMDGRRVMIAWMQSWEYSLAEDGYRWLGMMTFPRELTIRGNRVCQNPVREIEQYHRDTVCHKAVRVGEHTELEGICGRCLDMTLDIMEGDYKLFEIRIARGETCYSSIIYEPRESILTFSRENSGRKIDWAQSISMYVREQKGKIRLRILLDQYSVELFANDGEQAMSSLIYTPLEAQGISFRAHGEAYMDVKKSDVAPNVF